MAWSAKIFWIASCQSNRVHKIQQIRFQNSQISYSWTCSTTLFKDKKKKVRWHMTYDMWQVTCETWHGPCDTLQVTCGEGWTLNIFSKYQLPSSYCWGETVFWRYFCKGWVTQFECFCRITLATPGMLILWKHKKMKLLNLSGVNNVE